MKYRDLAKKADEALRIGVEYIADKDNLLPSAWDPDGLGWHELWHDNILYAGVYASCEGIILLSHVKQKHLISNDTELIRRVYTHNLCHIFDERSPADRPDDNYGPKRQQQRDKTLNAAYKLAKFLWASCYIEKKDTDLTNQILGKLYKLYDSEQHMFKNTASDQKINILATIFAYIALSHLTPEDSKIKEIEHAFFDILNNVNIINESNFNTVVFILWGISQNLEYCDKDVIKKAANCMKLLLENGLPENNAKYVDKYNIKQIDTRDNFSINKYFILLIALEQFIYYEYLEKSYINIIVSEVDFIADKIIKNKAYSNDNHLINSLFWENCYALHILDNFSNVINKLNFQEDNFMIIRPKNFVEINPIVNEKSGVVLMPINDDWSNGVYTNFADAATGFELWRSDQAFNDDIVINTIWRMINNAYFVIADCTGRNPNVFYELGIAHTLGKPVFMCAQSRADFPFDIAHMRSYVYNLSINGLNDLRHTIRNFINDL